MANGAMIPLPSHDHPISGNRLRGMRGGMAGLPALGVRARHPRLGMSVEDAVSSITCGISKQYQCINYIGLGHTHLATHLNGHCHLTRYAIASRYHHMARNPLEISKR